MAIYLMEKKGQLTDENIAKWAMDADETYKSVAGKRATAGVKVALGVEEVLIRFREQYGTEEECFLRGMRGINAIKFIVKQKGIQKNPLEISEEMQVPYNILASMEINPTYSYQSKQTMNTVSIPFRVAKRKNVLILQLLIGLLLAILTGFLIQKTGATYIGNMISALFDKFTFVFAALATPLVFCAVITGICGIGDAATFGRIGGRMMGRMLLTYLIAVTAMIVIGIPLGVFNFGDASDGASALNEVGQLVLDIVPDNLMEPFRIDNGLQVIIIAIFIGVTMLLLGQKVNRLKELIYDVGELVNKMMLIVCKLLPVFVYLGITDLIVSGRLNDIGQVSKIILLSLAGEGITICSVIIRTKLVTGLSFKEIIKPQLPPLLINLATSAQISALPASMKCLKKGYGVDEKLADFAFPIGMVMYMPNGAVMFGAIPAVLMGMMGMPMDLATVLKLAFVSVVVAIAAPPIPGSGFTVMPVIFSALGVDTGLMPLAVIVVSTVGYLLPAMNGFCLQEEILMVAWKSRMVRRREESAVE